MRQDVSFNTRSPIVDEQSECRKLKQATEAAAKIQREYAAVNVPLPTPVPVQMGGEAVSLAGAQAMSVMDELHQLRVERDGLLAQIGEQTDAVSRANELEGECDRLRYQIRDRDRDVARLYNRVGWIRNQVVSAVKAMDAALSPLHACQQATPYLERAIAETPAVADVQCDPQEVERLRQHIDELYGELKARDKTLGQLADIAEERDALLVRVETLEQQAQRRPPPMQSTTSPEVWSREGDPSLTELSKRLIATEAKLAGIPVDAEHLDRIGRRFESHLTRIERIERLLCGGDDPEDALNMDDLPSYPDLVNRVEIKAARFSERIDRLERHITKSWGFTGWRGQP